MWRNKQPTLLNKLVLSMKKGNLMRDGEPYTSHIKTPDDQKLLKLKPDEIKELEKIQVTCGDTITKKSYRFTGYTSDVQNYDEVNAAYELVRYRNMDVRHIICASLLPGTDVLSCFDHDDNDEHEAGAFLMEYMIKANLKNRALFIV